MTAHDCTTHNPVCPRCDLSRAEVEDPFIEAAREAADEYDDAWSADDLGYVAFELGAQWARAHLAAQEPTDAEVSAAYIEWDRHVAYGERGALRCHCGAPGVWGTTAAHEQHTLWHAFRAARAALAESEAPR